MAHRENASYLEILGGESGCRTFALDFYASVSANAELRPLFPGKSLRCASEEFAAFLIQFFDGDPDQTQYRWWLSLRASHARFQLTEAHRTAWLMLMRQTVDQLVDAGGERLALHQLFECASAYLIGLPSDEIQSEELRTRWSQQQILDEAIEHIAQGRDPQGIEQARQFATRPAVFVGILAEMMKAGREPCVDFTLQAIRKDTALGQQRFNGRTLLHFAAGHACLAVVQELLATGVDPDILDSGRHTPLYRAAGSQHTDASGRIVQALTEAGADVHHSAGSTNSTPLHEAARHGNLSAVRALLEAGANPAAQDRKALTPLDRARNCRKHEVAALLASGA